MEENANNGGSKLVTDMSSSQGSGNQNNLGGSSTGGAKLQTQSSGSSHGMIVGVLVLVLVVLIGVAGYIAYDRLVAEDSSDTVENTNIEDLAESDREQFLRDAYTNLTSYDGVVSYTAYSDDGSTGNAEFDLANDVMYVYGNSGTVQFESYILSDGFYVNTDGTWLQFSDFSGSVDRNTVYTELADFNTYLIIDDSASFEQTAFAGLTYSGVVDCPTSAGGECYEYTDVNGNMYHFTPDNTLVFSTLSVDNESLEIAFDYETGSIDVPTEQLENAVDETDLYQQLLETAQSNSAATE